MALLDTSVVLPGTGHLLTKTVPTGASTPPTLAQVQAFAADTSVLPAGYTNFGHTGVEPEFGSDGGETEVKPTWQNAAFDEVTTSEAVDYFIAKSCQIGDPEVLTAYYGGGTQGAGFFDAPLTSIVQERDFLLVMFGRRGAVGLWVPRVSVRKEGPIEVSTTEFIQLPLRFTFLQKTGAPRLRWIHQNFTAPAGP